MPSFNPRARDGREDLVAAIEASEKVSIHAPVMDANATALAMRALIDVSIHAPVMDAKCYPHGKNNTAAMVSIHAPVMDANNSNFLICNSMTFQSTRP